MFLVDLNIYFRNRSKEWCATPTQCGSVTLNLWFVGELLERAGRIELPTSSLGSWHSAAELRPLSDILSAN
jgi:hypothetical protein